MTHPTHGYTKSGLAVHGKAQDHLPTGSKYQRFNKRLAVTITKNVGTMTSAYIFCLLALCSLPYILSLFTAFHGVFPGWITKASILALIAWIAQTFLQLVLLPIIIVGQNVQAEASDARAAKTFEDAEYVKDQVNENTDGGLRVVLDKLDDIAKMVKPGKVTKTK